MRGTVLAFVLSVGELTAQGHPFAGALKIRGSRVFPASAVAADVDLDGFRDLVVGNAFSLDVRNGPMTAYLLDASFRVRRAENLPATGERGLVSHPAVTAGDFNGDKLPDLVSISDKGAANIHLNQGSTPGLAVKPRFKIANRIRYVRAMDMFGKDFPQFRTYSLFTGDFNDDGRTDVALTGDVWLFFDVLASSGMAVLAGDGRGGFQDEITIEPGRFLGLAPGDFNADGAPDLVGLTADNKIVVAFRKGGGSFRKERYNLARPAKPTRIATGDANGDGRADFFITGTDAAPALWVYLADKRGAPGKLLQVATGIAAGAAIASVAVTDMDGDRDPDVALLVVPRAADAYVLYLGGQGNGTFAKGQRLPFSGRIAQNSVAPFPNFLTATDFDGDQNPELVVASCRDTKTDKLVQWVFPNKTPQRWGVRQVGAATPGGAGFVPKISCAGGSPQPGNRNFSLLLADAPGRAKAALVVSSRLELRRFAGFTLHLFPLWSFGLQTTGAGAGTGNAALTLAIPNHPSMVGRRAFFQWIVADPRAPNPLGLSASRALEAWIGPR